MTLVRCLAAIALVCCVGAAAAPPFARIAPPEADVQPRLEAALPLDLRLRDADGRGGALREHFRAGRPVLLVLGYYRCPQLCGLLMHALLASLHEARLPRSAVRLVGVSIDPEDTPATARARQSLDEAYARSLDDGAAREPLPDLHLLTGSPADVARLAASVGVVYRRTAVDAADVSRASSAAAGPVRFAHPAVVIVATPQGRVSRYLGGLRFEPGELREAVRDAAQGRIGTVSDRIALRCAHVDLDFARHSQAVMGAARVAGLAALAGLLLAAWRWHRRGAGA